jgi:hypothetical protein
VLVLLVLAAAFLVSAGAVLAPSLSGAAAAGRRLLAREAVPGPERASPAPSGAAPAGGAPGSLALSREDLAVVLSYVDSLRPDDGVVEARPGVSAKRSNVEGVRLGGRTVHYDLVGHQSFGPLRAGKVTQADVVVLAREGQGDFKVVIYALEREAAHAASKAWPPE